MALGRAFAQLGVLCVSLAAVAGTGELGLRVLARPFDPVAFQKRNDPEGWDADGLGRVPLAFDRELFWRRTDAAETPPPLPDERLVLVLADGSACDPRRGTPWPERLQRLLDLNEAVRPLRVENACEPGYSSLQGRRAFDRYAGRPELVLVGLGANDARPVRLSDAEYAVRLEGLGPLARSWLALRAAHLWWAWAAPPPASPRVAPQDTRANLGAIAARARARGGEAVPLEPQGPDGPPSPEAAVFEQLATRGFVLTGQRAPAEAELGFGQGWPELEQGFGPVESDRGAPGRMLDPVAVLRLERRFELGLAMEVTCPAAAEATIEANGIVLGGLGGCLGRRLYRFSLAAVPDDALRVRLATPGPRRLLVHGVWLAPSAQPADSAADPIYASGLELGDAEDERPELGPGWFPREVWTDKRAGRWMAREASLRLERRGAEKGLLLEATLENPENVTACRIEVNGIPVYAFRSANGRHRYGVDIERVPGRRLHVRLVVERTFVPEAKGDERSLGLFVHSVRLASSSLP
jgi:hypothetical protein